MAEEKKVAKVKVVDASPDDLVYDFDNANAMDLDPRMDEEYLKNSEEFFKNNAPGLHKLMKRVQSEHS